MSKKENKKFYYHFVSDTLRDGRPVPADGEWLEHDGSLKMCERGLHASPTAWEALQYAPGSVLCLVEMDGIEKHKDHPDKVVGTHRRIIARFDATELLRAHARQSALSVIHLWGAPAPAVVREYLETGDESKREAAWDASQAAGRDPERVAAWDATRAAAWAAARATAAWAAARATAERDATRYAAQAAAWDAAAKRFNDAVDAKFKELGVNV